METIDLSTADGRDRALLLLTYPNKDQLLDCYLRLFPTSWRTLHASGFLQIPGVTSHHIRDLVVWAAKASNLALQTDVSTVLNAFQNPTQIDATFFELDVAHWCAERELHVALSLGKPLERNGTVKHPDIFWKTVLGDFYCEAKRSDVFGRDAHRRFETVVAASKTAFDRCGQWDSSIRLEIEISRAIFNKTQSIINEALLVAHSNQNPGFIWSKENVKMGIQAKSTPHTQEPDRMVSIHATIGTTPVKVTPEIADVLLSFDLSRPTADSVAGLVRDARSQLPSDAPSVVFLGHVGLGIATVKAKQLLQANPSLGAIAIARGGSFDLIASERHPEIGRLALEAKPTS